MEAGAPEGAVEAVVEYLVSSGASVHRSSGEACAVLGVVGSLTDADAEVVEELPGVARVVRVTRPYHLASRSFRAASTTVSGPWGAIGAERPWVALEPVGLAAAAGTASAELPYDVASGGSFDAAVSRAPEAPDALGALTCVSLHPQAAGGRVPLRFVPREPGQGLDDWLVAADRELGRGTDAVVLLEAGSSFPGGVRTLDVQGLVVAAAATHLPIVVDVPRIAARRLHVAAVAAAAIAAGASGVVLRASVAPRGERPRAPVTLGWEEATRLAERLRAIGRAARG